MHALRLVSEVTEQAALEMIWEQWAELGADAPPSQRREKMSLVDPEALLLLSLCLVPADHKIKELMRWWALNGARLTSVIRLKRLLPFFPPAATTGVGHLAGIAASHDPRWSSLSTLRSVTCTGEGERRIEVLKPSSLILRMRLIFGVNPTADVITYLLSRGNQPATARQIGVATGYGRSSIHRVLEGLTAAKIAGRSTGRPASYVMCAEAWQEMLGRNVIRTDVRGRVGFRRGYLKNTAAPMWLCWTQIFSFLAMLREACIRAQSSSWNHREVLRPVCDQFDGFRKVFIEHNLMLPSLNPYGDQYIWSLHDNISKLSSWYVSNA